MRSSRIRCAHIVWSSTGGVTPEDDVKRRRAFFDGGIKKIFVESPSSGKRCRKSSADRSASCKFNHKAFEIAAFLRLSLGGIEKLLKNSLVRPDEVGSDSRSYTCMRSARTRSALLLRRVLPFALLLLTDFSFGPVVGLLLAICRAT